MSPDKMRQLEEVKATARELHKHIDLLMLQSEDKFPNATRQLDQFQIDIDNIVAQIGFVVRVLDR